MKKLIYLAFMAILLLFSSCMDDFDLNTVPTKGAKSMDELKVSPDFKWNTSKTIEVKITGLPALKDVPVTKSVLVVRNSNEVYYSGFHAINENNEMKIIVPSNIKDTAYPFRSSFFY
jgi:hypothetical protein